MKSSPHANERRTPKALEDQTSDLALFEDARHRKADAEIQLAEIEHRETAMATHRSKSDLMRLLRDAAENEYARNPRPISANDIRHALPDGENKKVLGAAFQDRYWTRFGTTETNCPGATKTRVGANRGEISTYVPTHLLSMWEEKLKADERRTA